MGRIVLPYEQTPQIGVGEVSLKDARRMRIEGDVQLCV
jgi:hypothetical protein